MTLKKTMPWFRFYTEVLDDPKVQRLPPHLFKTWVNLLCLAGAAGGAFPQVDDISFRLRMSAHDVQQQLDELILAGLVDIQPSGQLVPHNWAGRQFVSDSSTERVRKHRAKKCNDDETLHETAPDQIRTESETEKGSPPARHPMELVRNTFRKGGLVSVKAKREAAQKLNIEDAGPLVDLYEKWPGSKGAKSPDSLFLSVVEGFYRDAKDDVKARCKPIVQHIEVKPVPRASSALIASLKVGA